MSSEQSKKGNNQHTIPYEWNIKLSGIMNRPVFVETFDGHVRRETTITAIRWTTINVWGQEIQYPNELVFEDDDGIPFNQIKTIKRSDKAG